MCVCENNTTIKNGKSQGKQQPNQNNEIRSGLKEGHEPATETQ